MKKQLLAISIGLVGVSLCAIQNGWGFYITIFGVFISIWGCLDSN